MSIAVLTACPDLSFTYEDVQPGAAFRYAGDGSEQRVSWQPIPMRRYTWPMHRGATERRSIDTFFRTSNGITTSFYVKDPDDAVQLAVSLGTSSTAAQTQFSLPAWPAEDSRYYVSSMTLKDDGAATSTTFTSHTDARTVGMSTAPSSGSVMTADITAYRRVRLAAPLQWKKQAPDWFFASPSFVEVIE